jgi:DNA-binding transcriptional LysR family regulator
MNELETMDTFVRVIEAGSFSAAALILGVAQPSISRRVAALEAELGVALLVRTTRKLALTDAGTRYLEAARAALAAVERARRAAIDEATRIEGRLRIAAVASFGSEWLAPRLPEFRAQYPRIELQFYFTERFVDLVAEGMDLGVRIGGPDLADVRGRRLGLVPRHFVASPAWLAEHGAPASPEALAHAHGLVFSAGAGWRGWPMAWDGRDVWVRPATITSATAGDFLRALARAGEGVTVLPDWLVAHDLAAGTLVPVSPQVRLAGRELWLVWPDHPYPRAATAAFVEWMVQAWRAAGHDARGAAAKIGGPG